METPTAPPASLPIDLSVVMFGYNEGPHLEAILRQTVADLRALCRRGQLVFVDDGSSDGTPQILATLAAELPELEVIRHPTNRGIGEAVHSGYAQVRLEYVCILPADGQITMRGYAPMLPRLLAGADLVMARYRRRGEVDGLGREVLSQGLRALNFAVLGVGRRINSAFVFRRALLEQLPLTTRSFFVNLELPLRAMRAGLRVEEVDLEVQPRVGGHSKVLRWDKVTAVAGDVGRLRVQLWREAWAKVRRS